MKINRYPQLSSNNKIASSNEKPLMKLKAGEIFKGQIIDIKQGKLTLLLETTGTVEAKLQNNLYELKIGQSLYFRVQSLTNEQILIEILSENWTDPKSNIILEALEAANLSPTEENYKMVESLLDRQLPIDKDNLHTITQLLKTSEKLNLDKLLLLMNNEILINEKNISQLDGYIEHNINLHNQLEEFFEITMSYKDSPIYKEILDSFIKEIDINVLDLNNELSVEYTHIDKEINTDKSTNLIFDDSLMMIRREMEILNFIKENQNLLEGFINNNEVFSKEVLFSFLMNDLPDSNIKSLLVKDNNFFMIFAENLKLLFNNKEDNNFINKLLSNKSMIFFNEIMKDLYLSPEQLKDKDKLKDSLNKLYKYINNIESLLSNQETIEYKGLLKASQEIKNNLEFMNQLNKFDSFVQIPIKLNDNNSQAELYVFRKRKHSKKQSNSVSALIALELVNIGQIEVFVQKNDRDIFLQFSLESDLYIKTVKGHINKLINSLNSKGYQVKSLTFNKLENSFNILKPIKKDYNINEEPKRFTFDMRV